MTIFQNAIASIQIGVEDYNSTDTRRSVSAVRNIVAGVLLLYKEKLCRLSPDYDKELLIRKDIRPVRGGSGELFFKGNGKNTVDVQVIKERFNSLKVNVEWTRFDDVNKLRNELEHYYSVKSIDSVREIISKSFLLIRDFVTHELNEDPRALFGEECWLQLLAVAEVYRVEEAACQDTIGNIDWKYDSVVVALQDLRCPVCFSPLVQVPDATDAYPDINLNCKSCHHAFQFVDVAAQCVTDSLAGDAYVAAKNGGEPPYGNCPECGLDTFVFVEKRCVVCEYEVEFSSCARCGSGLDINEQVFDGLCSYCSHVTEKSMAE